MHSSQLSYQQMINCDHYPKAEPKERKISKGLAFYSKIWQCEMREILTDQNLQLNAQFCLQMVIETLHDRILILSAGAS